MNLYEMIGRRKSVREYQMKPIDEKVLAAIRKYLKEILPLYPDIPYEIEISCSLEEKKAGILSVNAPYYVSFLTKEQGSIPECRIYHGGAFAVPGIQRNWYLLSGNSKDSKGAGRVKRGTGDGYGISKALSVQRGSRCAPD